MNTIQLGIGIIREGLPEDVKDVYGLICDMEDKVLPKCRFKQIYAGLQADGNHVFLLYVDGGQVTGCIHIRLEWQLHHVGRICEIMELAVRSGSRGKGIGRRLFDAACERARAEGCSQIEVCCNQLRHRAHKFYLARGMHNFHYKFSLDFFQTGDYANELGR